MAYIARSWGGKFPHYNRGMYWNRALFVWPVVTKGTYHGNAHIRKKTTF